MFNSWSGRLVAATLGAVLCAPAALAQNKPAPAAAGPWTKIPALTSACYFEADPFGAKLTAALASVNASRTKQLAINQKIETEYKSIDPMEMASRMQQWMMSNPEEAMKYMQGVQAVGEDFNARMPEMIAAQQRFDAEEKDLFKRYQAALDTGYAPGYARHAALKKRLGVPSEYPTVKDESGSTPAEAVAEENAIMRQLDSVYATNCTQYWGATGQVPAWLKTYRAWLTQEFIPFNQRLASQNAQTYAIMNAPTATWKDTAEFDGVIKYLEAVGRVYAHRRAKPRCDAQDCGYN